jgi:hypothetical protein
VIRDARGSAAVVAVALLPLLLTVFIGVLELGALRVLAARVASAADLATLAAVDDQDEAALLQSGAYRLPSDADAVARRFFALNLEQIATHLAVTPERAARDASVAVFHSAPAVDPVTRWTYDRPTVRLSASVPVRTAGLGALGLPGTTLVHVRAASAAR